MKARSILISALVRMYTERMTIDPFLTSWTQFPFSDPLEIVDSDGLLTFAHLPMSPPTIESPNNTGNSSNTAKQNTLPIDRHKTPASIKKRPMTVSNQKDSHHKTRRGRPVLDILDTQDEESVKRRRTQIRIAQRAFRLRGKQNTSTLQARVLALESRIGALNDAFHDINDCVLSSGIFDTRSELSEELRVHIARFSALMREAGVGKLDAGIEDSVSGTMGEGFGEGGDGAMGIADRGVMSATLARGADREKLSVWGYEIML